jgi:hypothetical protein
MLKNEFFKLNLLFLNKNNIIMKKMYLFIALFVIVNSYSQYNPSAPWNRNNNFKNNNNQDFKQTVYLFNEYWKDKDFSKKGSGHKPFKRWENHWENSLNQDGKIMTAQLLWELWQEKNRARQNKSTNLGLPQSNWTPIGPFSHTNTGSWSSGQGRVNVICVDPSNANTIYVGAPAGGIWKSTNNGVTWLPLSDNLPQIGVSGIAIDPTNSDVIYIATGDKDSGDTYSVGVLKSTDGGTTWNTTGLSFPDTNTLCGDLIIHPTNNQILFCATSIGLYKTSNAGLSWTNVEGSNYSSGSLRFKPNSPDTVYAVSFDTFFVSTNTGDLFLPSTTGLPASSGRLLLDVTANDPNYIYILSADQVGLFQGIYRSTDSGSNWTNIPTTSTIFDRSQQAFYDMALAVSQTNKDEIYTGVLNVWKSLNGGTNFTRLSNWNAPTNPAYTHADIHFLKFYGDKLFCGSDGGIYVSSNNGTSFTDLTSGLQISQFYKISVSKQFAGKMVGGLQDNGGHAYSGGIWKNYYGADGMDTAIDPNNSNKYYGFIQYGANMYISSTAGNSLGQGIIAPTAETGTNDDGGNWVTPLTTNSIGEVFSGYSKLYKLDGGSWIPQSVTVIGTSNNNIELIAIDPSNDNIMFVANGNKLYKSINKGVDFTNPYTTSAGNITSINVNYSNSDIIYITTSGTGGQALKSTTGGLSFTSFSEGLPAIPKRVIRHQGRNSLNPLYLGTSLGVYYRDDSMSQWEPFDTNLPNVEVTDLEINLEENIITAATYGRGIWQSAIPLEIPSNDIKLQAIQSPTLDINCGGIISPQIVVKNNGSNTISAVNVTYDYNGAPQNFIWNGSIVANATQSINIPNINATRGAYNLNVTATITGDAYSDNNKSTTPFYVNDSGTFEAINTFESASDAVLTFNDGLAVSQWQRGSRATGLLATGTNNVYATNLTGNYPNSTKAYLFSQCYDLTNAVNPQIKFKMSFDLEPNWDIVYVEYTTNMGQAWTVLGTKSPNWYNSDRTNASSGTANDCQNCPGAQWTATNATLTDYFYPLNNLIGQSNVIFRIVFHSDEAENQLGVNIDNFVIEGTTLSNQNFELSNIAIYPNPSSGKFNISSGNVALNTVEVYDVTGKKVVSLKNFSESNSQSILDLNEVSNGVYFVKISSENQSTVKRIIKN